MESAIVRMKKNRKVADVLRAIQPGESIVIRGRRDEVIKSTAYRLKKEGYVFATSVKGLADGIKIERVQ